LELLLPASPNPKRDREIFLQLLTMDPESLRRRKSKAIPLAGLFARLRPDECDDKFMLQSGKADETCLTTATELKRRECGTEGFGSTLLRHVLFAIDQTADRDDTMNSKARGI
jgi:hypothetical protein